MMKHRSIHCSQETGLKMGYIVAEFVVVVVVERKIDLENNRSACFDELQVGQHQVAEVVSSWMMAADR